MKIPTSILNSRYFEWLSAEGNQLLSVASDMAFTLNAFFLLIFGATCAFTLIIEYLPFPLFRKTLQKSLYMCPYGDSLPEWLRVDPLYHRVGLAVSFAVVAIQVLQKSDHYKLPWAAHSSSRISCP